MRKNPYNDAKNIVRKFTNTSPGNCFFQSDKSSNFLKEEVSTAAIHKTTFDFIAFISLSVVPYPKSEQDF